VRLCAPAFFRHGRRPSHEHNPPSAFIPYFKVHPGKNGRRRALLPAFVETTKSEPARVHYEFTINGDMVFCREAYKDAAGTLAHLQTSASCSGK